MARIFPGGSTVTRTIPPGVVEEVPPKWVVDYEIDFTSADVHNFISGGASNALGGAVTWTADALAYATTLEAQAGVGLVIEPKTGSGSDWDPNGVVPAPNAPRLTAAVSDLSPTAGLDTTLCFQAVGSSSPAVTVNFDCYGLLLANAAWTESATLRRIYNTLGIPSPYAGEEIHLVDNSATAAVSRSNADVATVPTFHEICLFPGGSGYATSSSEVYPALPLSGGLFTDAFSYDRNTADESTLIFKPSNLRAGPLAFKGGGSVGFTATWTHFRVLRLEMT